MAELKSCPFCGSPGELRRIMTAKGWRTVIRCSNNDCYMWQPTAFTSWHNGDSAEHAELRLTTEWNRRTYNVGKRREEE